MGRGRRVGIALLLGLLGCGATPEDVVRWKGTEKGPGKLRALLADQGAEIGLRAQAAVALCDIHRAIEVEESVTALPKAERSALLDRAVPRLIETLGSGPARSQSEAKDCLYRLRGLSEGEARAQIDDALVAWLTADLVGRMSAGSVGSEQVLLAIGGRAQGALLAILQRAGLDDPALLPAASLLGRVGDRQAKATGATALIKLVGPLLSGEGGAKLDGALSAIGALGGSAASRFLGDLAERGPVALRAQGLAALRQAKDPSALELALRLAWDAKQTPRLREAAFAYLETLGAVAVPGLCQVVKDPRQGGETGETVRFRAFEAALAAGGASSVAAVLSCLPERPYSRSDLTALAAHRITEKGTEALPGLRQALAAPGWVARAVALLALGELGQPQDVALIESVSTRGDAARLLGGGWPPTVADLAKQQAQRLRDKR